MPLQEGAKELCLHSQCLHSRHELRAVHRASCDWIQSRESSVRMEEHRNLIETLGDPNLQTIFKDERMTL